MKEQRRETVEEYLKRGGVVEQLPQVLNTTTSFWNPPEGMKTSESEVREIKAVTWKSIEADDRFDGHGEDMEDSKYWKTLNKRLSVMLKKMKRKEIKRMKKT